MAEITINPQALESLRSNIDQLRSLGTGFTTDAKSATDAAGLLASAVESATGLIDSLDKQLGGGGLEKRTRDVAAGLGGGLQAAAQLGVTASAIGGPVIGAIVAGVAAVGLGTAGAVLGAQQEENQREVGRVEQAQANLAFQRRQALLRIPTVRAARKDAVEALRRRLRRGR